MAAIRIYRACPSPPRRSSARRSVPRALRRRVASARSPAWRSFDHVDARTRVKRESKSFLKSPHRQSVRTPAVAVCAVAGRIARTRHTWTCLRSVSQWRCAPCTLCCRLRDWMWVMRKIRVSFHGMACTQSGMYAISSARHTKHHAPHPPLALHPGTVRLAPACPFVPNVCAPSPMCLPQYV